MTDIITLAPSELDYMPMKYSRCFYLSKIKKINLKNFPPPVFSEFDVVQQGISNQKIHLIYQHPCHLGKLCKKINYQEG